MDQRKWENLNKDCLGNVFGRVGLESLLLDVPFVCKSWCAATLNPSCWLSIDIPDIVTDRMMFDPLAMESWKFDPFLKRFVHEYRINKTNFSVTAFIKFVINRSKGHATFVRLPLCSQASVEYVADMCPNLKDLSSPNMLTTIHPGLIQKWKHLESLTLGCYITKDIISQLSIHCKNLRRLHIKSGIGETASSAIVNLLPNIKYLSLRSAYVFRDHLIILLQGCKELEVLDARDCGGFDEGDDEVLKLASRITSFSGEGSKIFG